MFLVGWEGILADFHVGQVATFNAPPKLVAYLVHSLLMDFSNSIIFPHIKNNLDFLGELHSLALGVPLVDDEGGNDGDIHGVLLEGMLSGGTSVATIFHMVAVQAIPPLGKTMLAARWLERPRRVPECPAAPTCLDKVDKSRTYFVGYLRIETIGRLDGLHHTHHISITGILEGLATVVLDKFDFLVEGEVHGWFLVGYSNAIAFQVAVKCLS
jgi:hypothetical protein